MNTKRCDTIIENGTHSGSICISFVWLLRFIWVHKSSFALFVNVFDHHFVYKAPYKSFACCSRHYVLTNVRPCRFKIRQTELITVRLNSVENGLKSGMCTTTENQYRRRYNFAHYFAVFFLSPHLHSSLSSRLRQNSLLFLANIFAER